MKNRSYRQTSTGVRIPKRKIKWMPPIEDASEESELLPPTDNNFSSLFTRNLDFFLQPSIFSEMDKEVDSHAD